MPTHNASPSWNPGLESSAWLRLNSLQSLTEVSEGLGSLCWSTRGEASLCVQQLRLPHHACTVELNKPQRGVLSTSPTHPQGALTLFLLELFLTQEHGGSSVTQSCLTLCEPLDCSMPGFPVHHQLLELTQTCVHRVGDAIQPSHPPSSPSPPAFSLSQHQGLFK